MTSPLCTPCSDNAVHTGLVTSTKWRRDASLRPSCTVNSSLGRDQPDAPTVLQRYLYDMMELDINSAHWEEMAGDQARWATTLQCKLSRGEDKM